MTRHIPYSGQQGLALIEGLIAILIFSLGILSLVGLQAATKKQTIEAKYRTEASFAASQVIGQMWAHRKSLGSYVVTDEDVSTLPNGKRTVAVDDGGQVTVTVKWQPPGSPTQRSHVVVARIKG